MARTAAELRAVAGRTGNAGGARGSRVGCLPVLSAATVHGWNGSTDTASRVGLHPRGELAHELPDGDPCCPAIARASSRLLASRPKLLRLRPAGRAVGSPRDRQRSLTAAGKIDTFRFPTCLWRMPTLPPQLKSSERSTLCGL